ncbi:hypothetical protein BCR34DRAFT_499855 [Clohesyomyces aquaticus]|uniref:Uncharacterized protein n=1 Tax=Clohesyomyces aquaticus TaxID=1231657 RepID=A0A1Y1Y672_9PLEO|nr:hypothetical protein BCR34DRAFT_499855 [Clohesyomyces aquaticus]
MRKPSAGKHRNSKDASESTSKPAPKPKHQRTKTAPDTPTLLRIPSSSSTAASASPRRQRATTNPSSPSNLTPSQVSTSTATSPSYFSPQPQASGKEPRSPPNRRPPASFSGHGIDTSRGPPIALITRGSADIVRRTQKTPDFAFAQHNLLQLGLASPAGAPASSAGHRGRKDAPVDSAAPSLSRQNSSARSRSRSRHMASSEDDSEYDSGMHSGFGDAPLVLNRQRPAASPGTTNSEQGEDLFLNIAEDSPKESNVPQGDRRRVSSLRSRIARANNRQSLPTNALSTPAPPSSTTPNANRISSIDSKAAGQYRRTSHLPSPLAAARALREQSPLSPANVPDTPRNNQLNLSPQTSFSRSKEQEPSPHQFLSQYGRRRPSYTDAIQTPPSRNQAYRPSNLYYSSSRDAEEAPQIDTPEPTNKANSRADGTESLDSTGPPASVWDELDDLKSRIRKIEMGGKIPSTSAAVINGESPQIRQSIEPESNVLPRSSPSRALSRIEARRSSLLGLNGSQRDSSLEPPPTPSLLHNPNRLARAGTSLNRTRHTVDDEDEDPTMRAPSRAMTDFREIRPANKPANRFSREYTSREPMPELQPSPSIQHTASLRRPTVTGATNENNHLLFRDSNRRYLERQNSPAYEKQLASDLGSRAVTALPQYSSNRTSVGASSLARAGSLTRRLRGKGGGE